MANSLTAVLLASHSWRSEARVASALRCTCVTSGRFPLSACRLPLAAYLLRATQLQALVVRAQQLRVQRATHWRCAARRASELRVPAAHVYRTGRGRERFCCFPRCRFFAHGGGLSRSDATEERNAAESSYRLIAQRVRLDGTLPSSTNLSRYDVADSPSLLSSRRCALRRSCGAKLHTACRNFAARGFSAFKIPRPRWSRTKSRWRR